jgi:hypothetical protein
MLLCVCVIFKSPPPQLRAGQWWQMRKEQTIFDLPLTKNSSRTVSRL